MKKNIEGIVVQVTKAQIVLLCHDGTFQNVPRSKKDVPLLGQNYQYKVNHFPWNKYMAIASVLFFAVISLVLLPLLKEEQAYIVALDINPSFELFLSSDLKIIGAKAINSDGENLLNTLMLENNFFYEALKKIIRYSEDNGFFDEERFIASTVISMEDDPLNVTTLKNTLESTLSIANIDAMLVENDAATLRLASSYQLSINQLQYYEELRKDGIVDSLDDVKGKSVGQLRKLKKENTKKQSNGNNRKDSFSEMKNNHSPHPTERMEKNENAIDKNDNGRFQQSGKEIPPQPRKPNNIDKDKKEIPASKINRGENERNQQENERGASQSNSSPRVDEQGNFQRVGGESNNPRTDGQVNSPKGEGQSDSQRTDVQGNSQGEKGESQSTPSNGQKPER